MKRKHLFVVICAIGSLFTACQEKEKPIPMSMELAGVQLEISGSQVGLVAADTTGLIIVRDSVANEATDTIYNVRTNVTLVLDSTFTADKMEEELLLNVLGADGSTLVSLAPTDSMIVDSLMAFLKKGVGEKIEIGFAGNTEKSKFLKLNNATKVTLVGFSFHEFDPEAMADPAITQLLNKWQKYVQQYRDEVDELAEAGGRGIPGMFIYNDEEKCYKQLSGMVSRMSPKQKALFDKLDAICKRELSDYMPRLSR